MDVGSELIRIDGLMKANRIGVDEIRYRTNKLDISTRQLRLIASSGSLYWSGVLFFKAFMCLGAILLSWQRKVTNMDAAILTLPAALLCQAQTTGQICQPFFFKEFKNFKCLLSYLDSDVFKWVQKSSELLV